MGGHGAKAIGAKLRAAMRRQGVPVRELAERAGKDPRHIEAVLDGYPDSAHTPLDTVDEIAAKLGKKLDLTDRS